MKTPEEIEDEAQRLYALLLKGVNVNTDGLSDAEKDYLHHRIEILQAKVDTLNWVQGKSRL